jgi:MerR family copper efflux transcriptional regulator
MTTQAMTIGQVARRTGISIKTLREYEGLGLLYTRGRSESNYRLFDESVLWCLQVIQTLRSLGLTLKDIQALAALYRERPTEPIGPHLAAKLTQVLRRTEAQIGALHALQQRIRDFQAAHAAELTGKPTGVLFATADPRRTGAQPPLDSPPGGRVYATSTSSSGR